MFQYYFVNTYINLFHSLKEYEKTKPDYIMEILKLDTITIDKIYEILESTIFKQESITSNEDTFKDVIQYGHLKIYDNGEPMQFTRNPPTTTEIK